MAAAKGNKYCENRRKNPQYTQPQIDKLIEDLLEYANSPNGLYLATFTYEKYKRPAQWLSNLGEHHPDVKEALRVAHDLIAGKIATHCWIGDRNATFGEKILPMYCNKYKALKKELQNKEENKATVIEIHNKSTKELKEACPQTE